MSGKLKMDDCQSNYPAVSASWAMDEFPDAREAERSKLIELATITPGMKVLDLQAAGGYLSDGIYERLQGDVDIICLEPCRHLSCRLSNYYKLIEDPVERWCSIESGSCDLVIGLAGLHHSNDQQSTVCEAYRVLNSTGKLVICDVIENSDIAKWLNEYVNDNNPAGHKGNFLNNGEMTRLFQAAGFKQIEESICSVPWLFESKNEIARFFKGLFGLEPSENEICDAIDEYLKVIKTSNGYKVDWNLIYTVGIKI